MAAAALIAPGVAQAQEETRASIDVSPNVGYSSNPFSGTGNDLGSGYAAVDIAPQLQLLTARDILTVSGMASIKEYFQHYAEASSYNVSADYAGRPSERVNTHVRMDLSSAIVGAYDTVGDLLTNPAAGVPPPTDLALYGSRDRRRRVYVTGDFNIALSEHDKINVSSFYESTRYRSFGDASNYDGYGSTFGYSRQISAATSVGLQGSLARYVYPGQRGDTRVISTQATASTRLGPFWTLDGAVGVSFVDSSTFGSTHKASLSGNATLCRKTDRTNLCFVASRSVRPTGFNGTQYVNMFGIDGSRKLSEHDTISLHAAYTTEAGSRSLVLPGLNTRFLLVSAMFERRLSERLRVSAMGQYRNIFTDIYSRPADIGGRIGLSYRFGDLQ
ncbi:hypothetical protein F9288_07080 [Sphingomonas sp. CL5.1]|uniref:hypothetical protein n=1 Tax=Sphingomonas sp. CL5.1 TaxID=2653203 RepID=UPI001583C2F9|nr:hypothetical protein [Sphingomonas sp. CL5.1]QKR99432.1 hypothetical protein F9288_07080 [Sphingomonas sp. CL5.1]